LLGGYLELLVDGLDDDSERKVSDSTSKRSGSSLNDANKETKMGGNGEKVAFEHVVTPDDVKGPKN